MAPVPLLSSSDEKASVTHDSSFLTNKLLNKEKMQEIRRAGKITHFL
jgi:hypothetical protein